MARKSLGRSPGSGRADGELLAANLVRLGYADLVIRTSEVADTVSERTGKKLSRQRVFNLLNSIHIRPETFEQIAKGLGVKVSELTRDIDLEDAFVEHRKAKKREK